MNSNYATIDTYNEANNGDDLSRLTINYPPSPSSSTTTTAAAATNNYPVLAHDKSSNRIHVVEAVLEGYTMEPPIPTNASASLTLIYDPSKNSLIMSLKLRKLFNMISCALYECNDDGEKGRLVMMLWENDSVQDTSFLSVVIDTLPIKRDLWSSLLSLVKRQKLLATITTDKYIDGEIDGLVSLLY
jgi:hypothetical protein